MLCYCPDCEEDYWLSMERERERKLLEECAPKRPTKQCFKCWKKIYDLKLAQVKERLGKEG